MRLVLAGADSRVRQPVLVPHFPHRYSPYLAEVSFAQRDLELVEVVVITRTYSVRRGPSKPLAYPRRELPIQRRATVSRQDLGRSPRS